MPVGAPADGAEQFAAARGAHVRAGHAQADAGVGGASRAPSWPRQSSGIRRQVRHGLDQVRQVLQGAALVRVRQLDEAAFLQRVERLFMQSAP